MICGDLDVTNYVTLTELFNGANKIYQYLFNIYTMHLFVINKEGGFILKRNIASMENAYIQNQKVKEKVIAKRRKLLFRRLALFTVIAGVITYIMISTYITRNHQLEAKKAEKEKLDHTVAAINKQQALLKNQIVKLNDNDYIAKLARSEYFLSEKGEIIFNIPDSNSKKKNKQEDVSY